MSLVETLHVVVPAHDEEATIGRTLRAVRKAAGRVRAHDAAVVVRATVVLDACRDATARITGDLGFDSVTCSAGMVGAARRTGVARALACARDTDPDAVWIACTDADSLVPANWLLEHLVLARQHDLVLGRVRPDSGELAQPLLTEWQRRYDRRAVHVHGANMGFRLAAYCAVGGFPVVDEHEDQHLAEVLRAAGYRWTVDQGHPVLTSARRCGRTGGGFAGYLSALEASLSSGDRPTPEPADVILVPDPA